MASNKLTVNMAGEVVKDRDSHSPPVGCASTTHPRNEPPDVESGYRRGGQDDVSLSTVETQGGGKTKRTMMGLKRVVSSSDVTSSTKDQNDNVVGPRRPEDRTTSLKSSETTSTNSSPRGDDSDSSFSDDGNNHNFIPTQNAGTNPQGLFGKAIEVSDLTVYGDELEEQLDEFIHSENVVMFNRSWCLFSVDAMSFLVDQLGVTVHSFLVDKHPQGKDIMKLLARKNGGHKTTPVIFIRGEFLGGFDEVNALYASGRLEDEYLQGLSQADKCQEFITKSNMSTKPLFWFPETVDAHVIRLTGILSCLTSVVGAVLACLAPWGAYIAYGLAVDYFLRILAGSCFSPLGRIACLFSKLLEPKPRVGRPKQFASFCGFTIAGLASLFFLLPTSLSPTFELPHLVTPFPVFTLIGSIFLGLLAVATGMEGFLDFCLGCVLFKLGIKIGLVRK